MRILFLNPIRSRCHCSQLMKSNQMQVGIQDSVSINSKAVSMLSLSYILSRELLNSGKQASKQTNGLYGNSIGIWVKSISLLVSPSSII